MTEISTDLMSDQSKNKSLSLLQAGHIEMQIVQILSMLAVGITSTLLALFVDTIYGIFILTADIVYVVIFPQFTCAIFVPHVNTYGSFFGFIIGVILRFGGGEPSLEINPFIKYPFYDENYGQKFPFKTLSMVSSFLTIVVVSYIFKYLFEKNVIPSKYEITGKVLDGKHGGRVGDGGKYGHELDKTTMSTTTLVHTEVVPSKEDLYDQTKL